MRNFVFIQQLRHIALLFSVFASTCTWGLQAQTIEKDFNDYIQSIRENRYSDFPRHRVKPENHAIILRLASRYTTDTLVTVRATGYYMLKLVGLSSTDSKIRQQAVLRLLEGCKDPKSGNVSLCIDYLTQFNPSDFNPTAKDSMINLLQQKIYYFDEYVKLVGYVLADRALPYLNKILQGSLSISRKERWAVQLAMARAGDEEQIKYIVQKISNIEPNDAVVYHLVPDLIYTRQKRIFDQIIAWLNDDRQLCTSSNPDKEEKLVCGYRIMEMLAPAIQKYPYQIDATGELLADDYDKALEEIRYWFKNNPNYLINKNYY
ncbi:MAG: hypothetical protein ACP5PZ_07565 [Bacteroidales bacterium]